MVKIKFENFFYNSVIVILLAIAIISLLSGFILNESFFLKFSVDKELQPATREHISLLKTTLKGIGLASFILAAAIIYKRKNLLGFIKKKKEAFKNVTLLMVVLLLIIVTAEVVSRILLYNEMYGYGPVIVRFNKNYVHLNSLGYRDDEFSIEKKNSCRIVGLGDSLTYGWGIKNVKNSYLDVLASKLNSNGKNCEVLNFGKPGIDTKEEIKILKEEAIKYKPDIVIIGFYPNDFTNIDPNVKTKTTKTIEILPVIGYWIRDVSYFYYFLETRFNRLLEMTNYKSSYENSLITTYNSEKNKEFNKKLYKEIADIGKRENIKIVILSFPIFYKLEDYQLKEANIFLEKIALKYNIEIVGLLPYYASYKEKDLILNKYDRHPNELAHKIAAEAVYEKLINKGWI